MSDNGNLCPGCHKDIGLWAIIKMPYPTHFKCKHCGEPIKYQPKGWLMAIFFTIIYLSAIVYIFTHGFLDHVNFTWSLLIVVLLWVPFEIMMVIILRNFHQLKKSTGRK